MTLPNYSIDDIERLARELEAGQLYPDNALEMILDCLGCGLIRYRNLISKVRLAADSQAVPENLRPATASDIVYGAIIWKPGWPACKWIRVETLSNYLSADFLRGAFVAVGSKLKAPCSHEHQT